LRRASKYEQSRHEQNRWKALLKNKVAYAREVEGKEGREAEERGEKDYCNK
jgi:hypothetical protein